MTTRTWYGMRADAAARRTERRQRQLRKIRVDVCGALAALAALVFGGVLARMVAR